MGSGLFETTLAAVVPGMPAPLAFIDYMTKQEKEELYRDLRRVFPHLTRRQMHESVFGGLRRTNQTADDGDHPFHRSVQRGSGARIP